MDFAQEQGMTSGRAHAGVVSCAKRAALALICAAAVLVVVPAGAAARAPEQLSSAPAEAGLLEAGSAPRPGGVLPGAQRLHAAGVASSPSSEEPYFACPHGPCFAIVDPAPRLVRVQGRGRYQLPRVGTLLEGHGEKGGLDPEDLQSAYKIPTEGGEGQTVALVDAYGYPTAEADLAKYRSRYGLPPCTKADGCFRQVNQEGEEGNYPRASEGWETESALDIEMVSAACPGCHILLAEANTASGEDLAATVELAAKLGATEISNSWGNDTEHCFGGDCEEEDAEMDHPGVLVTVSAGDSGYDNQEVHGSSPGWPAVLPFVVSVGGTSLHKTKNARGWTDEVWSGSGGGCAVKEPKPIWQTDTGCSARMDNDVAAVGACATPVSVYNSGEGWGNVCGTSVSSPLVAGIEAHASSFSRSLPGADAFYQDPEATFDVSAGSNGACTPPPQDAYFCSAQPGYDGPSGVGVPNGPLEIGSTPAPNVRTLPASAVADGDGTLNGEVDPEGQEATYHFEYGTTTAYGSDVPIPDANAGSGKTTLAESAEVTGLQSETTYHFRLVASNVNGTSYGADEVFVTAPPTVTGVSPDEGPPDGATTVTINGTNFAGVTGVRFGARAAVSFSRQSETTMSAVAPQGAGTVDVTVTTPSGTSQAGEGDRYSFQKVGPVLAFGADRGGLGDGGEAEASEVPVEVSELPEATALAAGHEANLALLAEGGLEAWGENSLGSLGDGSYETSRTPVPVCAAQTAKLKEDGAECPSGPFLGEVSAVAVGSFNSLALLANGTVVAWGANGRGQLGVASEALVTDVPAYVCTAHEQPCKPEHYLREVIAIAAGERFSAALLRDGKVMVWGENQQGELGTGKSKGPESCIENTVACSRIPVAVPHLTEVTAIAAGGFHMLALLRDRAVVAWGENSEGELGDGGAEQSDAPTPVCAEGEPAPCKRGLQGVAAIAAGGSSSYAVMQDGTVRAWGSNFEGALGDGSLSGPETCGEGESCSRSPVAVSGLSGVSEIAAGTESNSVLALAGGRPTTWGGNDYGQLGDGTTTASAVPGPICTPFAEGACPGGPYLQGTVRAIAVGSQHDLLGLTTTLSQVTGVSPSSGPGAGGTKVTITGNGLTGANAIFFGSVAASVFEVRSASEIVAVAPRGGGTVAVTVMMPEGPSHSGVPDRYTYEDSTVTALSPKRGPVGGGTSVTITGTRLLGASAVEFSSTPASSFEVVSETQIDAVSPAGSGAVQVTVTTPEGTSAATPASEFTYLSPPAVTTGAASTVRSNSATLEGTVDPEASNVTDCHFEYGASEQYGSSVPCSSLPGEGTRPVAVAAVLAGVGAGATYHFRVVATNTVGTSYGTDATFTTPASELPEFGRCEKLTGAPAGKYTSAACTSPSVAEDSGAYEWRPGPGANAGFSASGGAAVLSFRRPTGEKFLDCSSSRITGTYTAPQTARLTLVLAGCKSDITIGQACQTVGAPDGEIEGKFIATLGLISDGSKPGVGLDLRQAHGEELLELECGGARVFTVGSIIAPIASADKMSSTSKLAFKVKGGAQTPESFEDQPPEVPKIDGRAAGLKLTLELSGEEPIEIKALP
jgi:alpha-tubulin suppressor-like RCC1 family protein